MDGRPGEDLRPSPGILKRVLESSTFSMAFSIPTSHIALVDLDGTIRALPPRRHLSPGRRHQGTMHPPETYNVVGVRADGTRTVLIEQLTSRNQAERCRALILGSVTHAEYPTVLIDHEILSLP